MRLIAFTDSHISAKSAAARLDDYQAAILAKLEFVFEYADAANADAVLCAGDFFDQPKQPEEVMIEIVKLLRKYNRPLLTTVGQHDTNGHNSDKYKEKSLGLLEAAGLLEVLNHGEAAEVLDGGYKIIVRGYAFNEPETDMFLSGRTEDLDRDVFNVALVHATVGPEDAMGRWQSIDNQDIRTVDLAIFGDVHCGFELTQLKSGTLAIGPGSLGRRRMDDMDHQPTLLDIEVTEDSFTVTPVMIPVLENELIFAEYCFAETDDVNTALDFVAEWNKAQAGEVESPVQRVRRIGNAFKHAETEIALVLENLPDEAA